MWRIQYQDPYEFHSISVAFSTRTVLANQFLAARKSSPLGTCWFWSFCSFRLHTLAPHQRKYYTDIRSILGIYFFFWNLLLAIFLPISCWLQMSTKCQLLLFEALMMDLKYYSNFWFQNPLFWSSWCSSPSLSISKRIGQRREAWSNPHRSNLGDLLRLICFRF